MRRTAIVVILALLTAAAVAAEPTAEKPSAPRFNDLTEAKTAAMTQDKPLLVDFYADW
ncbi:MAG: hypothetical protein AB1644_13035 [Candidatus Zixiibacteriota bacterium]